MRFEVGDAQALKAKDASFDNTLALLVMNFVPDDNKAIAEMRRVTRAQGIVSACVWDDDAGMQMLRFFWDEAVVLDPAIEPKGRASHETISPGHSSAELWKKAGLVNVKEAPLCDRPSVFVIQRLLGAVYEWRRPGGAYVVALPDGRREQLESRIRKRSARRSPGWPVHAERESSVRARGSPKS